MFTFHFSQLLQLPKIFLNWTRLAQPFVQNFIQILFTNNTIRLSGPASFTMGTMEKPASKWTHPNANNESETLENWGHVCPNNKIFKGPLAYAYRQQCYLTHREIANGPSNTILSIRLLLMFVVKRTELFVHLCTKRYLEDLIEYLVTTGRYKEGNFGEINGCDGRQLVCVL